MLQAASYAYVERHLPNTYIRVNSGFADKYCKIFISILNCCSMELMLFGQFYIRYIIY